ncbi:MAG TPA: sensor histidine kinase [Anaerolineae bacterium]
MSTSSHRSFNLWQRNLRQRLHRLSIVNRLLIGNSMVIVVSAAVGTFLSVQLGYSLADTGEGPLALLACFAVLLGTATNYLIIKTALRPLHELRETIDQMQAGSTDEQVRLPEEADPDVGQLAATVNSVFDRLDMRTRQLRAISERVINVQEDERKRIARRLHDDTGQALSTLIISLERMESVIPADAPDLLRRLVNARKLAARTLEDLRNVIYGLRPTMLDDLGLAPAIRWHARSSLDEAGVQVKFDSVDETLRLPPQIETTLFRIAQEAISNIVRHARAKSAAIALWREDTTAYLWVEDDGCGFDLAQISSQALSLQRLGLLGIRERAELVGGRVTVDSAPGRGTRLEVHIPLAGMGGAHDDGQNTNIAG